MASRGGSRVLSCGHGEIRTLENPARKRASPETLGDALIVADGGGAGNRTRVRKLRGHLLLRAYSAVCLVLDCAGRRARTRTSYLFGFAAAPVTRTLASQLVDGLPRALTGP